MRGGLAVPGARALDAAIAEVLIDEATLQARVRALGAEITARYADGPAPVLVGVIKGVTFFMADLVRAIDLPVEMDFLAISRYGPHARGSRAAVAVLYDLTTPITGRPVILVEDVIDTGLPVAFLLRMLRARQPASLEVCALLDRQSVRLIDIPLTYVGFRIPDRFVVGYGLDYQEKYRNLPYIGVLRPDHAEDSLRPLAG
ncbi:MAG TPA: hypoxanthine phosphoribosyltransferase [Chloroflexia bacterium]